MTRGVQSILQLHMAKTTRKRVAIILLFSDWREVFKNKKLSQKLVFGDGEAVIVMSRCSFRKLSPRVRGYGQKFRRGTRYG